MTDRMNDTAATAVLRPVLQEVQRAQQLFRNVLLRIESDGGLTLARYVRFLSMEYHLTNGVQRHFLTAAGHPDLARRRKFRSFLIQFANEEELHYQIAEADLRSLGEAVLPKPFDVALWWNYFNDVVFSRPFVRLGGTCVLENIGEGSHDVADRLLRSAPYLTKENSRFITIHRHQGNLAHGAEVIEALCGADLEARHIEDLVAGSRAATTLYLRMFGWVASGEDMIGMQ